MKHLLIVGARGWGREAYQEIKCTPEVLNGEMEVKGFLDSKFDALDGLRGTYPPIICAPEDYDVQSDDIFFVALGDSHYRKYYAELMENKGGHFYTYISPDANVLDTALIGEGSFISRWCIVSDNVSLGKHVLMHEFSVVGHDAVIKNYGTLLNGAFMGGYSEIGVCTEMNPRSMIIPHKKVGDNVKIGAVSVVMRNMGSNISLFGNPAVKLEI